MDVDLFVAALDRLGVVALLVAVLVSGAKGIWVWGYHYRQVQRDRSRWRELALSGTRLANRALNLAVPEDEEEEDVG